MPDFGSPVAQNVNVNPTQGIQTISSLLGLKQQQLALQTGEFAKQSAAAGAATAGVEAQGATEASAFLRDFDFGKHIGPDGTLDANSALTSKEFQRLGPGKPIAAQGLLSIKNAQIKNKQDMATLNTGVLGGVAKMVAALTKDKNVQAGNPDGIAAANATLDLADDMYGDQGKALTAKLRQAVNGEHKNPGDLASKLTGFGLQAYDVLLPKTDTMVDKAGNIVGTTQDVVGGQLAQAQGAGVQPGLGPTQTPGYQASVSAAQAAATGGVASDVDTYNQIRASGNKATAIRSFAQQAAALAKDVDTGPTTGMSSKLWAGIAQQFGFKPTDINDAGIRRQILGKVAAQLVSQAEEAAPSDAVRQNIEKAYPDPANMNAGALIEAARTVDGMASLAQKRLTNAEAFKKSHKGIVTGLSTADSMFAQHANPYAAHYADLSPADQRRFLEQHFKDKNGKVDKAAVIKLIQDANALKHANAANQQVIGGQQ